MSNLPFTLPSCEQPATIRLELYSAADGHLLGLLDASVYTCEHHGIEAVASIWRANLTAQKVTLAPDVERTCGEVYVYPTGALGDEQTASTPTSKHPRWCESQQCDGRWHRGRLIEFVSITGDQATATVQLQQSHPGLPLVVVSALGAGIVLTLNQGKALAYTLATQCRLAERSPW